MPNRAGVIPPDQPDPRILRKLFIVEQIGLFLAVQLALINLLARFLPHLKNVLPAGLVQMQATSALAALCAVLGLFLSEATESRSMLRLSRVFAVVTMLIAIWDLIVPVWGAIGGFDRIINGSQIASRNSSTLVSAVAFVLIGFVILFLHSGDSASGRIADVVMLGLFFLVFILLTEFIFGLAELPGSSTTGLTSTTTLGCLSLITLVIVLARIEYGAISIFAAYGMGSRIARILAPILLVLPCMREILRAHLLNSELVPRHYATAVLTSVATVVVLVLLLLLTRLMNKMHSEIQDLNLRDELTGLYSVRGFYLLAEQAYRFARRAQLPFGVLFVDMDNLKTINDELGHDAGSASLVETAQLLNASFRETDIVGRVGGDEFIVVGQFNELEIEVARKNHGRGRQYPLSLSIGHATTENPSASTLKSLVAMADKAMYDEKRKKKGRSSRGNEPVPSVVSS
jgi:diguanylate cyclase (GGDEF)-like protein